MEKFELAQREVEKKTKELEELEDRHREKLQEFEEEMIIFKLRVVPYKIFLMKSTKKLCII